MKKAGKWLRGYVLCRAVSGSWERFMNMCRFHGIAIWNVKKEEKLQFCVPRSEFKTLKPIAKKTGVKIHIVKKSGFPFVWNGWVSDWTFYSGVLLFLAVLFVLSSFVWEITYQGQNTYTKETLSKTVEAMDVYPGMRRSRLDCDAIEKQIRQIYPDISWVSAEEKGSVLQISIKEGEKTVVHEDENNPSHLTAANDGVVEQIVVGRGTAAVKAGQKVKKGDVLIRGIVPVTDDNDEVVENLAVSAKGDVTLLVTEEVKEEISLTHKIKEYTGRTVSSWQIGFGDRIFFIKNPFKQLDNSMKYDILKNVCADRTIHPFSFLFYVQKSKYLEYQWKEARYTETEIKTEGMKRYQALFTAADGTEKELVEHEAVLKKKNENAWLLHAVISYRSHELGRKAVTKDEITITGPDGGQNGESGTNS
jgi:similar to stage IV sporulation protein